MKIGIIAAMPEELAYLVQHLDNAQEQVVLGNTYHTGTIASHEVVLVESGIGKVMCAYLAAKSYLPTLDDHHHWYSRSGGRGPCSRRQYLRCLDYVAFHHG